MTFLYVNWILKKLVLISKFKREMTCHLSNRVMNKSQKAAQWNTHICRPEFVGFLYDRWHRHVVFMNSRPVLFTLNEDTSSRGCAKNSLLLDNADSIKRPLSMWKLFQSNLIRAGAPFSPAGFFPRDKERDRIVIMSVSI